MYGYANRYDSEMGLKEIYDGQVGTVVKITHQFYLVRFDDYKINNFFVLGPGEVVYLLENEIELV